MSALIIINVFIGLTLKQNFAPLGFALGYARMHLAWNSVFTNHTRLEISAINVYLDVAIDCCRLLSKSRGNRVFFQDKSSLFVNPDYKLPTFQISAESVKHLGFIE